MDEGYSVYLLRYSERNETLWVHCVVGLILRLPQHRGEGQLVQASFTRQNVTVLLCADVNMDVAAVPAPTFIHNRIMKSSL